MYITYLHLIAKDFAHICLSRQFLQPKDTMHGFEWKDVRGIEGTGFVRALRTILTGQLPDLLPGLDQVITSQLDVEIKRHGSSGDGFVVPMYEMCKRVVTRLNCAVFFGPGMAEDVEFFEAAYRFPHDSAYAAELIRLLPQSVSQIAAKFVTSNFKSSATLHQRLAKEIRERLDAREHNKGERLQKVSGCLSTLKKEQKKKNLHSRW